MLIRAYTFNPIYTYSIKLGKKKFHIIKQNPYILQFLFLIKHKYEFSYKLVFFFLILIC